MTALIVTGPLLPRPAKSLPAELESFMMSSGDDGVIVVSFGSMVPTLPTQTLRILAKVLGIVKFLLRKQRKLVIKESYQSISIKIALHFCLTLLLKK